MNTAKNTHTIGIDLGDKSHETCTLNAEGEIIERTTLLNNQPELIRFSKANRGATLIMEAGCHSPWISRLFNQRGHKVVVANPRKVRAIYQTDNKNDERDALLLARIGRFDRNLLYGIEHKSEAHQRALKIIEARDALVTARVKLVNHVRGSLKSLGIFLPSGCSTEAFARKATEHLEAADYALVAPVIESIGHLSELIKSEDKHIDTMIAEDYPVAQKLLTIPGVGPITALSFVLIIGSPDRFATARDVGPFLGLVPGRDQSGDVDKPMRITKAGNRMMRRLLVSCAQYTLGHFGPPSALKEAGERKANSGAKIAKKKAVVMTARKLAVMMLALWKDPNSEYEPFPGKSSQQQAIAA
ncbi:IS110 family transposase [Coraliomargarita algicola]|uniref:IS110 family transposase n=1 Tax=Coraliomargarita algicola TaxID=3092156 RepID=A0ABZ0RJ25_9BACT|nr:IS110 family transposase [Coraliomargarita sp. J2-16]WPJ94551.1 IS110 family transposase [Coraliomargarita sp. J2-16]WPJ95401.1 IS110 family transposase [Coraliomargarita sp. J2-16]